MSEELFRMENITKIFPGVVALDDVSFSINKGEVHGLVGENGAGKSTLMKIMSGVYQADSGKIFIENQEVSITSVAQAAELGVSIIFQELNLFAHLSVADNIYVGRPPTKGPFIDRKSMHKNAADTLKELGIDIDTHVTVGSLSIAQQQMVEIAKAISHNSKILVLDEPTATLTEKEIDQLFLIIKNLQKKGVGMVYISHRMEELERICERVTIIRDGRYIATRNYADITIDELVTLIVGRTLEDKYPTYKRTIGEVVLEARNVRKGRKVNVDHLEVRAGEILGISGLVGAGRTEIMRCIYGADRADSKEIYLHGEKVTINNPRHAIAHGIGLSTEDRKFDGLALNLDVSFNINMASLSRITKNGFVNHKKALRNAEYYKETFQIRTPNLQQPTIKLSGGNQQKVVLSKCLSNDIKVLIVDEPTRGIDVGAKYEVYELFNRLSDEGVAIIMISSDLPEILGMSDRVLVIHEGAVNGELVTKETTQEEILYLAAGYNKLEKAAK